MTSLDIAIELAQKAGDPPKPPLVVGLGGTLSPSSSTEKAIQISLDGAAEGGAEILLIPGPSLEMPIYAWERKERTPEAQNLIAVLRRADGIIIGSPGYHGSISGLVKNALDYTQDMAEDEWPYFHGRPVGSITTGAGWQGAVTTLTALRGIVHALRGWNTPLGVAINTAQRMFDDNGKCLDAKIDTMLRDMGREVAESARVRALMRGARNDPNSIGSDNDE
jgi:FMN reductase